MGLTMTDFTNCRLTPNREMSIYDAIAKFFGCNDKRAREKFNLFLKKLEAEKIGFSYYQFMRADGKQKGRKTPVAVFSVILEILSQLPGEDSKVLRREQARITTRVAAGDASIIDVIAQRAANIDPDGP